MPDAPLDRILASLDLVGPIGTVSLEAGDPGGHHALCSWHGGRQAYEWLVCRTAKSGYPYVASGYVPTLWEAVEAARAYLHAIAVGAAPPTRDRLPPGATLFAQEAAE